MPILSVTFGFLFLFCVYVYYGFLFSVTMRWLNSRIYIYTHTHDRIVADLLISNAFLKPAFVFPGLPWWLRG